MGECLITRRGGEAYELPVLDENYPQDVSLTVIKGNTVSATFNAIFATHGKPAEYTYQWYVDGAAVEGANSAVFVMADLGETVNHSVYCEITNKAGTVTTRVATLKVTQHYTPILDASYPADVTLNDGSTTSATFKVQIDTAGNPAEHTYQWYVNGESVEGETGASYTRTNLIKYEVLSVYCAVTNAVGTVQSRTATLTVGHTLLYINGTRYNDITGGFATAGRQEASGSSAAAGAPTITYNASNFKISQSASKAGIVYTTYKIDVTNHKTLHVQAVFAGKGNTWFHKVYVWNSIGSYAGDNVAASWGPSQQSTSVQNVTLNVSSITGSKNIGFYARTSGTAGDYYIVVSKMWLV